MKTLAKLENIVIETNEQNGLPELPKGWILATIGEVGKTTSGGTPSRGNSSYYNGSIGWLKSGELKDGLIYKSEEFITELGLSNSSAKVFPKETLCIALYGATVGRLGILKLEMATNQAVCGILLPKEISNQYLFHYLFSQRRNLIDLGKGGAQPNINQEIVQNQAFPLPPLNEQARIVAKIEELFTKLDAGVDALRQIQKQIKRFRQAVLRDAVTGELTKAWREENQAELEPAADLLKRILTERREHWEQEQLKKFTETGKTPKNDDWKKKYKEPTAPIIENLPELPNIWTWATIQQFASFEPYSITDGPFGSNLKTAHYREFGARVIRLKNIGDGKFVDAKAFISLEHFNFLKKHQIKANDLVIATLGERLPFACIIPESVGDAIVKADCVRFSPNKDLANVKFLNFALNAENTRDRITEDIHGVGRPRLNLGEVREIALSLPPLAEQQKIVEEVERLLSVADAVEATVKQSLKQAERLRQSILKRAFEGKLVPQDETDEPASILLERIKAEREEQIKAAQKQKVKAKKKKTIAQNPSLFE